MQDGKNKKMINFRQIPERCARNLPESYMENRDF